MRSAIYYKHDKHWTTISNFHEDFELCAVRERQEEEALLTAAGIAVYRESDLSSYNDNETFQRLRMSSKINSPIELWTTFTNEKFTKRKVRMVSIIDLLENGVVNTSKLRDFADSNGNLFLKTINKNCSGIVNIDTPFSEMSNISSILRYPSYQNFIASELLEIKQEYRFWCVDDMVINGSTYGNYRDTSTCSCPEYTQFCQMVLDDIRKKITLPRVIIIDIATTDRGLVVVEMNPYECSGRYYYNFFSQIADAFYKTKLNLWKLEGTMLEMRDIWKETVRKHTD